MRQTISGLVAAFAVVTASAVPAMACGGGWFGSSCSPCGEAYIPCAQYVAPVATYSYSGCYSSCGGCGCWPHERLPDPEQQYGYVSGGSPQYYYVNQGPTFTGPGNWAPLPAYQEATVSGSDAYRRPPRRSYRYGPRYSSAPYYSGHRVLRRYY
jgi:hypothetical protein